MENENENVAKPNQETKQFQIRFVVSNKFSEFVTAYEQLLNNISKDEIVVNAAIISPNSVEKTYKGIVIIHIIPITDILETKENYHNQEN